MSKTEKNNNFENNSTKNNDIILMSPDVFLPIKLDHSSIETKEYNAQAQFVSNGTIAYLNQQTIYKNRTRDRWSPKERKFVEYKEPVITEKYLHTLNPPVNWNNLQLIENEYRRILSTPNLLFNSKNDNSSEETKLLFNSEGNDLLEEYKKKKNLYYDILSMEQATNTFLSIYDLTTQNLLSSYLSADNSAIVKFKKYNDKFIISENYHLSILDLDLQKRSTIKIEENAYDIDILGDTIAISYNDYDFKNYTCSSKVLLFDVRKFSEPMSNINIEGKSCKLKFLFNDMLLCGSNTGELLQVDPKTMEQQTLLRHNSEISDITPDKKNTHIVVSYGDGVSHLIKPDGKPYKLKNIIVYQRNKEFPKHYPKEKHLICGYSDYNSKTKFSPENKWIGFANGCMFTMFKPYDDSQKYILFFSKYTEFNYIDFNSDNTNLLASSNNNQIYLVSLKVEN